MTIRSMVLKLSTAFALTAAAGTTAAAEPLRNLDAELNSTGQVAVPTMYVEGDGISDAASMAQRAETRIRSPMVSPPRKALIRIALRDDPLLNLQYGSALATSLEACRFDAARRLRVTPAEIVAGVVTLRWTLEPSGEVRDVSVVARSATDEAVTACASGVVASHILLSPVKEPVALEWTYAFRNIRAITGKTSARRHPNDQ